MDKYPHKKNSLFIDRLLPVISLKYLVVIFLFSILILPSVSSAQTNIRTGLVPAALCLNKFALLRLTNQPPPDTIVVYDTIYQYEYLYDTSNVIVEYDTVYEHETVKLEDFTRLDSLWVLSDTLQEDTISKATRVFADVIKSQRIRLATAEIFFVPAISVKTIAAQTASLNEYASTLLRAEPAFFKFSAGAGVHLAYNNWVFQTGICHTNFWENTQYASPVSRLDSMLITEYKDYGTWRVDTTIGETYLRNGVLITEMWVDSSWVTGRDTLQYYQRDTVTVGIKQVDNKNLYTYLELPIMGGFQIVGDRNQYFVKAGVIAGVLRNASGQTLSIYNQERLVDLKNVPYRKYILSFACAVGINHRIHDRSYTFAELHYTRGLRSIFNDDYGVSQTYESLGLRFGFRFAF